jgi:hypothetical protein
MATSGNDTSQNDLARIERKLPQMRELLEGGQWSEAKDLLIDLRLRIVSVEKQLVLREAGVF